MLAAVLCTPLETFVETPDPAAVLCYTCDRMLNNIHSLKAKVKAIKADVQQKGISAAHGGSTWSEKPGSP